MKFIIELEKDELTLELFEMLKGYQVSKPVVNIEPEQVKIAPVALTPEVIREQMGVEPDYVAPSVSLDDIKKAAVGLIARDTEFTKVLQELNQTFKIRSLGELKPDKYDAYAAELRGIGAQI